MRKLFFLLSITFVLFSCKKDPYLPWGEHNGKPKDKPFCPCSLDCLVGSWEQDRYPLMFAGSRTSYKFTCDSVYIKYYWWTDVIIPYEDGTFSDISGTEYSKGTYTRSASEIKISAIYTDSNYKEEIGESYKKAIPYKLNSCSSLTLYPDNEYNKTHFTKGEAKVHPIQIVENDEIIL